LRIHLGQIWPAKGHGLVLIFAGFVAKLVPGVEDMLKILFIGSILSCTCTELTWHES